MNLGHNQALPFELDYTMNRIAYYRVSTIEQSIESQRSALGGAFAKEFKDEGVSGTTLAASRPGFAALLEFARDGDTLYVYAVDRLGRDALDVQSTVRNLLKKGISVHIHGLGLIAEGVGELILAVLAQVGDRERKKIIERTAAGRVTAQEHLARTGKTHKGKASMGRPRGTAADGLIVNPVEVAKWKLENKASIAVAAKQFSLSLSTIKRYCAM